MIEQVTIHKVVDSREPESIRLPLLETGWIQKALLSGDYMFLTGDFKRLGITRKRVDDLVSSIGDRFSKQLDEMLDEYDICYLLLEGSWKLVNPNNNIITGHGVSYVSWDMAWDYINRWQDKGFRIAITVNEAHTVQRLNRMFAKYQQHYSMSAKSSDYTDDRILAFPSGCRGKTAEHCLEKFGSLLRVALATTDELMTIEKIGQKKANLIRSHFNRGTVVQETGEIKEPRMDIEQGRIFWNEADTRD